MTTELKSIDRFKSIIQYNKDMEDSSRVRDYILSDEDKPKLNITRLTAEYSATGNNVDKIIESRKQLYRTLRKKFPNRGEF